MHFFDPPLKHIMGVMNDQWMTLFRMTELIDKLQLILVDSIRVVFILENSLKLKLYNQIVEKR